MSYINNNIVEKYKQKSKLKLDELNAIPQWPQRSPEWFEQRRHKLTSSDAGTALGLNPYQKPEELLFKKCGVCNVFTGNTATLHGQKYEDEAIEQYCKAMGKVNHDFGLISWDQVKIRPDGINERYPQINWMAGSPDGVAEDIRGLEDLVVLEVKCPYRRKIIYGKVPPYYYPQVQLNMAIMGIDKADYIEYKPAEYGMPMQLNIVRVNIDWEWFENARSTIDKLWNEIMYWKKEGIQYHNRYDYFKRKEERLLMKQEDRQNKKSKN